MAFPELRESKPEVINRFRFTPVKLAYKSGTLFVSISTVVRYYISTMYMYVYAIRIPFSITIVI